MGYQPQSKPRKGTTRQYRPFREKTKTKKHQRRSHAEPIDPQKLPPSAQEIAEDTLKRLHTLGSQKFGSFPYSEHFDRWIGTVEAVLAEFAGNPNIGIDQEYTEECQRVLAGIKFTLEQIHRREATINQEITALAEHKNRLQQINNDYATQAGVLRSQKNVAIRQLNRELVELKKEQDKIIKMKAGFFHRFSKKDRENREIEIVENLTEKQTELELAIMDLKQSSKVLREEFDRKKEPVNEEIKKYQKRIDDVETDGSLEERWFACETLTDAVNMFLLRKAAQPH
jgi:DNA repair exonuclease SbcCD ATPase subunit